MASGRWLRAGLDLVLPVTCLGCGAPAEAFCARCRHESLQMRVRTVGSSLLVAAAGSYDGALREALLGYKERGRRDLAGPLASLLDASLTAARSGLTSPVLVPMPSTPQASRRRGGDHMRRLVQRIGGSDPVAVVLGSRRADDATGLSSTGRRTARRRSMYVRRGGEELVRGRDVLLVDDIVTTGATLDRAAEIVLALGARQVRGAVIAETEKQVASR